MFVLTKETVLRKFVFYGCVFVSPVDPALHTDVGVHP